MGLAVEVMNITKYPLAIGMLCAVGVVMITEHLAYLVHELEAGIRAEFRFIFFLTFHILPHNITMWKQTRKNAISGHQTGIFSIFCI